ncbi:uncharacterized protein DUF350 [Stackebrandtia albiflava]|uniref:Uncharacterized protein DUF350 n=1 Tax=Stackebrandtia albiflava TaxID=406432 RepID=A0A562UY58_9ACTN|nr:DUF350 domain-containing protein [Stackebrandtia albiflava]TWJ10536.1 uncharacterized protein DUF350 [Stackebrandtia albiflava]
MLLDLATESLAVLAYCGVGIVLMALGFVTVDIVTPGNLRRQIWTERNRNAAILLASNLLAVGVIVTAAIWASEGDLVQGLAYSFVYGLIGLIVMALAFVLLDALTPGKLGEILVGNADHPAVWVSAAMHLAVAGVVVAGLS